MKISSKSSYLPSLFFTLYVATGVMLVILTDRFEMPWSEWIASIKFSKLFALFAVLVMCASLILASIKIKISLFVRGVFFTIATGIAIFWDAIYKHSPLFVLVTVLISVGVVLIINYDNWFRSED